jgi:hypothetical protein
VLGIIVGVHESPRTIAMRVREELGAEGEALAASLHHLDQARYAQGGLTKPDPSWWREFSRAAQVLRRRARVSAFSSSVLPR